MDNPSFSFNLPPLEAIAHLKEKGIKQSFDYYEIMHNAHNKSFTVAKIMRDDLLFDMQQSLIKAQVNGTNFKDWQKNIKPTLIDYGWYGETSVTNPRTGEVKDIFVGSRRLKNIFKTNMRVSYAKARYKKMMELPVSVYWMYISMLLPTTRDQHSTNHQTTLHREDSWWSTNYPPNGWGCKCKVRAYSKKELEQYISQIKSDLNDIYIDKKNKAKMFIFKEFGTFRTPFLIILNKDGKVKYWQAFQSSIKAEKACFDLINLLEAIS